MQIPVLIEAIPGSGYRASSGEPFAIVVEADTPEEALAQFKGRVAEKLRAGASVTNVEVQPDEHAWKPFAGMYDQADPIVKKWLEIIRSERDDEASE